MPPPVTAELPDGMLVELVPLAEQVCRRHLERHPEDVDRYGHELAYEWCVHDQQHTLAWAIEDRDLKGQITWLANILRSRGYPVLNLVDCVEQAAEIVRAELPVPAGSQVAERMRDAVAELEA